jgi:hypothetical protein
VPSAEEVAAAMGRRSGVVGPGIREEAERYFPLSCAEVWSRSYREAMEIGPVRTRRDQTGRAAESWGRQVGPGRGSVQETWGLE